MFQFSVKFFNFSIFDNEYAWNITLACEKKVSSKALAIGSLMKAQEHNTKYSTDKRLFKKP